jgi:hypothetical protein
MKESEHPSTLETPSPSTSRTATVKKTLFLPSHPYLSRKVDVVDDVDCWKIGWALVDAKPEGLLDTLHATNRDLYPATDSIISILLTMLVYSATGERSFSVMRRLKSCAK